MDGEFFTFFGYWRTEVGKLCQNEEQLNCFVNQYGNYIKYTRIESQSQHKRMYGKMMAEKVNETDNCRDKVSKSKLNPGTNDKTI